MKTVIVFAEGQTEEAFINDVVAPEFWHLDLFLIPRLLRTSKHARGGAVSYDRLRFYAKNTLKQREDVFLTTFLDLYGLDNDFPDFLAAQNINDLYQRTNFLETALSQMRTDEIGCMPERFFPYIQPHEYEGLLFSDINKLVEVDPGWDQYKSKLEDVTRSFDNPEYINNSYETKPSKRLETILTPKYRKTTHGPIAAKKITLATLERECPHFKEWVMKLRTLASS